MDHNLILDLATDLGYRLAIHGAETFRVEESISRLLAAYDLDAEIFAIPNCIIVSVVTSSGKPITRMRRVGHHGTDLDSVERYNSLCRKICSEKPTVEDAFSWLRDTDQSLRSYKFPMIMLGYILGASGFCIFFGGTLADSLCAGVCGMLVGLVNMLMTKTRVNPFFSTIISSFILSVASYLMGIFHIAVNSDTVIIGALMFLVPGLLFTNAMRDIIFGDTNSGVNRIVQVLLIAAGIALGTGVAWNIVTAFFTLPVSPAPISHNVLVVCLASYVACVGFFIVYNIHGIGGFLCALGGVLCYGTYALAGSLGADEVSAYFFASIVAASYAEAMARIRKCPAIAYLVVSIFPMIPGAGIYYTANHLVRGDMSAFADQGAHTIALAGAIAVGILLVSTAVRVWVFRKHPISSNSMKKGLR